MLLALVIGRRASRKSACKDRSSLGSINRFVSARQLDSVYDKDTRTNPQLSQYRYLAIGDEVVLIDPRRQKIVEVID